MESEQLQIAGPALTAEEYKFVDAYCQCRDVSKAAVEAGFQAKQGQGIYRRAAVHAEIAKRTASITVETDKLIAKKRVVNVEALDKALMEVVGIKKQDLLETPSLATPKVNAIELGYRRTGLLMDDNFIPDAGSAATQAESPRIYRPGGATIITHRITETREVVTETPTPTPRSATPPPVTLDGEWDNF